MPALVPSLLALAACRSESNAQGSNAGSPITLTANNINGEVLTGGSGNDVLRGGPGPDTLFGGGGNDSIHAGVGDLVDGGAGEDTLYLEAGWYIYTLNVEGNTTIGESDGYFALTTPEKFLRFRGIEQFEAADSKENIEISRVLFDSTGADVLTGGSGDDSITSSGGNDRIDGGEGLDSLTITYGEFSASVSVSESVSISLTDDDGYTLIDYADTQIAYRNIEALQLDRLHPLELNLEITGSSTRDMINGGGKADLIRAGDGHDTIAAGGGDDVVYAGGGSNRIDGGEGNDTVHLPAGAYALTYNVEGFVAYRVNAAGYETLYGVDEVYRLKDVEVTVDTEGDALTIVHTITGSAIGDRIRAGSRLDRIDGKEGADTLTVLDGTYTMSLAVANTESTTVADADGFFHLYELDSTLSFAGIEHFVDSAGMPLGYAVHLTGGALEDNLLGTGYHDVIFAGELSDYIVAYAGDDTIDAGAGNDNVFGGMGADTILGGEGNDNIRGEAGPDTIDGGDGADTINGGDGDDTIVGGDGDDMIDGGEGNDTIDGGAGDDTIVGGEGDNTISGDAGADTISSGAGNDTIDGGEGDDMISAGEGDDRIIWFAGNDRIDGGEGVNALIIHAVGFAKVEATVPGYTTAISNGTSTIHYMRIDDFFDADGVDYVF